jgi:hypothetical protein
VTSPHRGSPSDLRPAASCKRWSTAYSRLRGHTALPPRPAVGPIARNAMDLANWTPVHHACQVVESDLGLKRLGGSRSRRRWAAHITLHGRSAFALRSATTAAGSSSIDAPLPSPRKRRSLVHQLDHASRYEVIGSCNRGRWAAHSSPAFAHEGLAAGHMSVWRRPRAWESRGACSPPTLMSCSAPRRRLGRRRRPSRPSSRTPGRSSTLLTAQASRPSLCGCGGG